MMSYIYKVQEEDSMGYSNMEIIEFSGTDYVNTWPINKLSQNFTIKDFSDAKDFESFMRTQEWVRKKHPDFL
jgi:hypothetical protein